MKTISQFAKTIPGVAVITLILLSIPLIAMQFSTDVNWSPFDFLIMGLLIFTLGVAFVLVMRHAHDLILKIAAAAAIGTTFFMIWANLAVGLIGAGPHAGNFMYMAVVAVVLIGTYLSKFKAKGMELTMFSAALSLVLIAIIALLSGMDKYPSSSVQEIIAVNSFFIFLYATAGLLFRYVALEEAKSR